MVTDVFARLAVRAVGRAPVSARHRSVPFEAVGATTAPIAFDAVSDDQAPVRLPAPKRSALPVIEHHPPDPEVGIAEAEDRDVADEHSPPPHPASGERQRPSRSLAPDRAEPAPEPHQLDDTAPRPASHVRPRSGPSVVPEPGPEPVPVPDAAATTEAISAAPPAAPPAAPEMVQDPKYSPQQRDPPRPRTKAPARSATRTLTPEALLRAHLAPALAHLGVIAEREKERLVVAPSDRSVPAARDGRILVGVDPVDAPVGGDLHLHIDRVVVVRPEPKAPATPAPVPTPRPGPDHSAYLARQRDRWRQ